MKTFLLIAALLTPATGIWLRSDGTQEQFPCPGTEIFAAEKAVKLPQGCVSHSPGVWMPVTRFSALKAEAAAYKAKAESLKKSLVELSNARQSDAAKAAGALQKCSYELQSGLEEIQRLNRARWGLGQLSTGFVAGAAACGAVVYMVGD